MTHQALHTQVEPRFPTAIRQMLHGTPSKRLSGSAGAAPRSRELPGGTFWLSKEASDHDIVYGQEFVLQRPRRGGPGLVISSHKVSLAKRQHLADGKLAVRSPQRAGPPAPRGSLWDVTDITDYSVLEEHGLLPSERSPFLLPGAAMTVLPPANHSCTGIVLHPLASKREQGEAIPDKNPRRTKKVKFTCKLCETESIKRVSPHGWTAGSVFARCDGCGVVHKLVDNLKIFHEFKGSVFPTLTKPTIKIPEGLPQKPGLDHHVHPAIYPHLPADVPRE